MPCHSRRNKAVSVIFLFILLADKRYREFARGLIYSALLIILPFFAFSGVSSLETFCCQSFRLGRRRFGRIKLCNTTNSMYFGTAIYLIGSGFGVTATLLLSI